PRLHEAVRLLLTAAARPAAERALPERPLQQGQALVPAGPGDPGRFGPPRLWSGADARDAAADGAHRRDDRRQGSQAEAVPRAEDRRLERIDRLDHRAAAAGPGAQAAARRRAGPA